MVGDLSTDGVKLPGGESIMEVDDIDVAREILSVYDPFVVVFSSEVDGDAIRDFIRDLGDTSVSVVILCGEHMKYEYYGKTLVCFLDMDNLNRLFRSDEFKNKSTISDKLHLVHALAKVSMSALSSFCDNVNPSRYVVKLNGE